MNQNMKLIILIAFFGSISVVTSRPHVKLIDLSDTDTDDDLVLDQSSNDRTIDSASNLGTCDPCPAGWGVKKQCDNVSNTICTPCPAGYWSPKRPHYRPCTPCSKCGDGLYEDIACTSTRDTQCDSCSNVKGHLNEDYKRKCDWKHAPESMKSADDESTINDNEPIDEDKVSKQSIFDIISDRLKTWRSIGSDRVKTEGVIDKSSSKNVDDQYIDDEIEDKDDIDQDDQENSMVHSWSTVLQKKLGQQSIVDLSRNFITDNGGKDNVDEEDDDEDTGDSDRVTAQANRPPFMHVMRPFAAMVPPVRVNTVPKSEPIDDGEWEDDDGKTEGTTKRMEVNYRPSYHSYPIDALMHRQRRQVMAILIITFIIAFVSVIFVILLIRAYRQRRRSAAYNKIAVVNLSEEEREIVRKSATKLSDVEKPVKQYRLNKSGGYTTLVNAESTPSLAIRENPFEAYLNGEA